MASPPLTAEQTRWPRLLGAATSWRAALRAGLAATYAALRGTHDAAQAAAAPVKEALAGGAVAVAEGAVKAASVPANVAHEVRREVDDWWAKASRALAEGAILGILALLALILLTLGAVVLLNDVLGDPYGTLVVGALYLAAIAILVGRREARKRREEDAEATLETGALLVEHPAALPGAQKAEDRAGKMA